MRKDARSVMALISAQQKSGRPFAARIQLRGNIKLLDFFGGAVSMA